MKQTQPSLPPRLSRANVSTSHQEVAAPHSQESSKNVPTEVNPHFLSIKTSLLGILLLLSFVLFANCGPTEVQKEAAPSKEVTVSTEKQVQEPSQQLPDAGIPEKAQKDTYEPTSPLPDNTPGQEPQQPDSPLQETHVPDTNTHEPVVPENNIVHDSSMPDLPPRPQNIKPCPGFAAQYIYPVGTADGKTACPSKDSRIIYVSAKGSDNNDGLSPTKPVKTPKKAQGLLRRLKPDWLVFKRGDTFPQFFNPIRSRTGTPNGGRSLKEPMVITAYGQGTKRPVLSTTGTALNLWEINHITVSGLAFKTKPGSKGSGSGIRTLTSGSNHVYEDNVIQGFVVGIIVQGGTKKIQNVIVDGNIVVDSSPNGGGHSQGMFASSVLNMTIRHNIFDICGWWKDRDGKAGGSQKATIFNHCLYLQKDSGPSKVHDNIITRASSHGMQARSGAFAERNIFARNALSFFIASKTTGTLYKQHKMYARYNIVQEGDDITSTTPRGFGIQHLNAYHATYEHNIISHVYSKRKYNKYAYAISCGSSDRHTGGKEGCSSLFQNNIIANWGNATTGGIGVSMGTLEAGMKGNHTVTKNTIMMDFQGASLARQSSATEKRYAFSSNTYIHKDINTSNALFSIGRQRSSFAQWKRSIDKTGTAKTKHTYPDPCRTLATYYDDIVLGNTNNDNCKIMHDDKLFESMMQKLRTRSRLAPLPEKFRTKAIVNYIRQGFGLTKLP